MEGLHDALEKLDGKDTYLSTKPAAPDFTRNRECVLIVSSESMRIEVPLPQSAEKLKAIFYQIVHWIGGKDNLVLGYNLKNLYSYVLGKTGRPLKFEGKVVDLKLVESFNGVKIKPPQSFVEARRRFVSLMGTNTWEQFKTINRHIYTPLLTKVIPELETQGLTHQKKRCRVYSHYELEGTLNGRMKCHKVFQDSFMPHTMRLEEKEQLCGDYEDVFLYLDFKHQEVSILQWLSNDPVLGEILDSGRDLYEAIWENITGLEATPEGRQKCKSVFLPVVYGLGPTGVAERLKISGKSGKILYDRIHKTFPVSMYWVANQQSDEDGIALDHFGRRRHMEQEYKVRNYVVAAPASLICMHKLVKLHEGLGNLGKLAFHLHDGYCILTNRNNLRSTSETAKRILETDDEQFYPHLKLSTACQAGTTLATLKSI